MAGEVYVERVDAHILYVHHPVMLGYFKLQPLVLGLPDHVVCLVFSGVSTDFSQHLNKLLADSHCDVLDLHRQLLDYEVALCSSVYPQDSIDKVVFRIFEVLVVLLGGEYHRSHEFVRVVLIHLHKAQPQLVGVGAVGSLVNELQVLEVPVDEFVGSSNGLVV